MLWITRPTPRSARSASIDSSSRVLRASRSGLVTISTSPSRQKARHSASLGRSALVEEICSLNTFSAPAAFRSRCCAAKPAVWSQVDVRAYPTFMARRFVLFASKTIRDNSSEIPELILFGRDFRGFPAI